MQRVISMDEADDFARNWIAAFNTGDLALILSHYAEEVELISPIYLAFTEGRSDKVSGKAALAGYFEMALARYPELHFTLLEIARGTRSVCLRYHSNIGDRIAIECFERDAAGKAARVTCHYGIANPQ